MRVLFSKYQGTGNDFVMLDNLSGQYDDLTIDQIQFLCNRKLGVGADGLIKISRSSNSDFEADYFNADGSKSFCGNGARCSVAYAKKLGIIEEDTVFSAIDGNHSASIKAGLVRLEMMDVNDVSRDGDAYVLDTGSPHYVQFVEDSASIDIIDFGKKIRYNSKYEEIGINVNLAQALDNGSISVKTYERGVEDETLSCGTGVTACALVYKMQNRQPSIDKVEVVTKGGILYVECEIEGGRFNNIWLTGPAIHVYDGEIDV